MNTDLTLLNVGLARHQGDWNWRNVRSPFARIYYVVEGRAQVLLPDGRLELTPGRLYLIPPFTTHHYVCSGLFTHYYVHLYEQKDTGEQSSIFNSQSSIFNEWDMPHEVGVLSGEKDMMVRLCQLNPHLQLHASDPDTYDNHTTLVSTLQGEARRPLCERMEVQGILQVLLSRFLRQARRRLPTHDRRVQQALTFIHQHTGERIELDRLAREACVSKDHLIRIFRQATGETPTSYITRRRLERAELLLITTDTPVKNIAAALSYDDASYFIRMFRQHTGMTPQEYRNEKSTAQPL